MDTTQLKEQLDFLLTEFSQAKASYEHNQKEYESLVNTVSLAKARLEQQPEINALLNETQDDIMKKSLSLFNTLLSSMLQEIMANEETVSCQLSSYGNLPALKILIENYFEGELKQRDIYHSKGGSVVNIISTGLRILSLIKLAKGQGEHRPFLVLDEPDNWLSPEKIEPFADLLIQVAKSQNMQIIMITHHNMMMFQKAASVYLSKQNNTVFVEKTQGNFNWLDNSTHSFYDGIQGVLLENYMSHKKTYIPFSRHLTVISGENDIGKSAIIQAIHDMAYGTGDDNIIQDLPAIMPYSQVSLFFESGKCVWRRNRKINSMNKSKELYSLYQLENSNETVETYQETMEKKTGFFISPETYHYTTEPFMVSPGGKGYTGVPDFVRDRACLGISKVEDIDIQIRNQKEPVFLLNETATTQAKILSVGQEINYLQTMRENYKTTIQLDKKTVDEGEKKITALLDIQDKLYPLIEKGNPLSLKLKQNARNITVKEDEYKLISTFNTTFLPKKIELDTLSTKVSAIIQPNTTVNFTTQKELTLLLTSLQPLLSQVKKGYFIPNLKQPNTLFSIDSLNEAIDMKEKAASLANEYKTMSLLSPFIKKGKVNSLDYIESISKENITNLLSLKEQSLVALKVKEKTVNSLGYIETPALLWNRIKNGQCIISKALMLKEQMKIDSVLSFSMDNNRHKLTLEMKELLVNKEKESISLSNCQKGLKEQEEQFAILQNKQKKCPCCGQFFHKPT